MVIHYESGHREALHTYTLGFFCPIRIRTNPRRSDMHPSGRNGDSLLRTTPYGVTTNGAKVFVIFILVR
jgi:hypothetical protein